MGNDLSDAQDQLRRQERWERAIDVSIGAVLFSTILTSGALWDQVGSSGCNVSPRTSCIANLRTLDGAKYTWALENHITNDAAVPTDAQPFGVNGYIREKPMCPKGGKYTLRSINQKPRCSIPAHTF